MNDANIELTPQQAVVAAQLREFFRSDERCFVLKGYAGTGKTFLIGHMARELAEQNREVMIMAPTGRAARVVGRKTAMAASTIHRAIYNLKELVEHDEVSSAFKFHFRLKDVATDNLDLVVFVDEASMVSDLQEEGEFIRFGSGRLLADLIAFLRLGDPTQKTKLVLVGDPAQLPPVNSATSPALDAGYLHEVHKLQADVCELTEVMRQRAGSPILREATTIRATLASGFHNRLSIKAQPPAIESLQAVDLPARYVEANKGARMPRSICIAYANATCLNLNIAIRSRLVFGNGMHPPAASEVLLVVRNSASTGLLNGELVSVVRADAQSETVRVHVGVEHVDLIFRNLRILAEAEDGSLVEQDTKIVENILFSEKRDLQPLEQKALYVHFKMRHPALRPNSREFAEVMRCDPYFNALQVKFGYAMTCHKAQGGEWEDVFICFENARTDALALRWAYTALTRARTRVFGINLPDRLPWAGAAVERVASAGDATNVPVKREEDAVAPTPWDELFPATPTFPKEQHRRMAASLTASGIAIEKVEVRAANFFWRYDVCKEGRRASLRINFKKTGSVAPQMLAVPGSDAALGQESLPLLSVAEIPLQQAAQAVTFDADKPFLQALHDEFMAPKAVVNGATIARVDHHLFLEKYCFTKGAAHVVVGAYYKANGTITTLLRERGSEELYRRLFWDD